MLTRPHCQPCRKPGTSRGPHQGPTSEARGPPVSPLPQKSHLLSIPLPIRHWLIGLSSPQSPPLDPAARLAEGVVRLQTTHWEWVQAWERRDLPAWNRILLQGQRTWRKIERTCGVDRQRLITLVNRSTTQGGRELWNPHHYHLDRFERRAPVTHQDVRQGFRQVQATSQEKRLYDEMANTYADIAVNMGAIREIAIKKMRRW